MPTAPFVNNLNRLVQAHRAALEQNDTELAEARHHELLSTIALAVAAGHTDLANVVQDALDHIEDALTNYYRRQQQAWERWKAEGSGPAKSAG